MPKKNRVGETHKNKQGYLVEIIRYISATDITVRFNDKRGTVRKHCSYKDIKNGSVKNKYHKSIFGIGYFGEGPYTARVNKKMSRCYEAWFNMMIRCYDPTSNRVDAYVDVTVTKEWHNYQNFAKWFYSVYDETTMSDYHLDKDLLSGKSKIYSPKTCCLLPGEINSIFKQNIRSKYGTPRGVSPKDGKYQVSIQKFGKQIYLGFCDTIEEGSEVYRLNKIKYLKEVAAKWSSVLPENVCNAIANFDISKLD